MNGKRFYYITFGLLLLITFVGLKNLSAKNEADKSEIIEKGRIITEIFGCVDCHSPKIQEGEFLVNDPEKLFSGHPADNKLPQFSPDIIGPGKWRGLFTDSMTAWGGPWGISYAANLTPDKKTGIGRLSEDNFVSILNIGIHSNMNRKLMEPMPWKEISELRDDDLKAVFQYLKTVKPVRNNVPESVPLNNHENLALNKGL